MLGPGVVQRMAPQKVLENPGLGGVPRVGTPKKSAVEGLGAHVDCVSNGPPEVVVFLYPVPLT